ncbi:MAG: OmpA family protein [Polaribacter sp.]
MKKIILLAVLFCIIIETNAQDFNKWSIDLGTGVHLPVFPVAQNDVDKTPSFWQANVGFRYMINENFGLRLDFGFNKFEEDNKSKSFETDYYRGTVEAIVNAGKLLGFREWTQAFNVLIHGGVGLSDMKVYSTISNRPKDRTVNGVIGITPQIKLTEHIALFLDASAVMHLYQDTSFDGIQTSNNRGINGQIFNGSIGLNIYLGKSNVHADWYADPDDIEEVINDLGSLEKRLQVAETEIDKLSDKSEYDKDGLISELDERYSKKGEIIAPPPPNTKVDFVKELLNKGYQNVYFDFGKSSIQKQSLQAINYLYKYMSENPSVSAELTGYADEIGSVSSNKRLSTKRAKRVYDVLVASGISPSRLSYNGNGEDSSVDKNSEDARKLVRRVTFTIK